MTFRSKDFGCGISEFEFHSCGVVSSDSSPYNMPRWFPILITSPRLNPNLRISILSWPVSSRSGHSASATANARVEEYPTIWGMAFAKQNQLIVDRPHEALESIVAISGSGCRRLTVSSNPVNISLAHLFLSVFFPTGPVPRLASPHALLAFVSASRWSVCLGRGSTNRYREHTRPIIE